MKRLSCVLLPLIALWFVSVDFVLADVRVPRIFSNNMVLQRDLPAPVWGWAEPGEEITVSIADQQKTATADAAGKWNLKLDSMKANKKGQTLQIEGKNKLTFNNVLIGDVWICSGQSNMEWAVQASLNAKEEIEAAKYPLIRLFDVPGHTTAPVPRQTLPGGNWTPCSPKSVGGFSAVGYFFGRHLHQQTGVPIGLIGTNWGGTRIEPWTPPVGFRSVPELKEIAKLVNKFDPTTSEGQATWQKYVDDVEAWVENARAALKEGKELPRQIATPGLSSSGHPCAIYHAMVHPLVPYGIRGAIWYQGESNGNEGLSYHHKMKALIQGWREIWNQKDFPVYFYYVQLANWKTPNENPAGGDGWAKLREAQSLTLTVPHTGMAVITDIGAANDIHPRNKQDVGYRLAQWGLRDVYQQEVVVSGPLYKSMKVEGNKMRISFDHVGSGLMVGTKKGLESTVEVADGKLNRFAIAGEDQKWFWAEAVIDGETVVVSCKDVPKPVAVRYGFTMNPEGANLYNKVGLPASPFRTDKW